MGRESAFLFPNETVLVLSCHATVMQQIRPIVLVKIQSTLSGDVSSTAETAVYTLQQLKTNAQCQVDLTGTSRYSRINLNNSM